MRQENKSRGRGSIKGRDGDRGEDRGKEDRIVKCEKQHSREISTHRTHKAV